MLIDPAFILSHPWEIGLVVFFATVVKFVIVAVLIIGFRYPLRSAIGAGVALAQMGEFSFVLVTVGLAEGLLSDQTADLALSAVLVTIVLSPFLFALHDQLVKLVERIALLQPVLARIAVEDLDLPEEARLRNHAIICGFGATGREMVHALSSHRIPFVVIEHDPGVFNQAQQERLPSVYGDAMSPAVLLNAQVRYANLLAIAIPDPIATQSAIATAKKLNPNIDVIARSAGVESYVVFQEAGASEVVHPQFEAGLEFVRHALQRFGVSEERAYEFVNGRRIQVARDRTGIEEAELADSF
jgi:CPA2 family monovalent cation:H+ antiporter-2